MIEMRDAEATNNGDATDYFAAETVTERHGMIYGVYHFPTGKWYVGQTVNTIQARAKQHWWSRRRAEDFFHLALADDPDPMTWVAFPLEAIPMELWRTPPAERRAGWRQGEVAKFRAVATPRERHWVDKLRSMWPKGWNSLYPGKPASSAHRMVSQPAPEREPARDLAAAKDAIAQWEANRHVARRFIQGAPRETLIEILEGLGNGLPPTEQSAVTAAIAAEAREALRKRKAEKKPRDFIRFLYGHPIARDLDLPGLLKDPDVYKLHPEPDVAAAIRVVHRFAPQIATSLFNYKDWAQRPAPINPNEHGPCPCLGQVLPGATVVDGHVLSTNPEELASPYLRDILSKGKKFRLPQQLSSVMMRLTEGVGQYLEYKKRGRAEEEWHAALEAWAGAVLAKAQARLTAAAQTQPPEPDGHPDLQRQMTAAQNALVFGPEDRAPHALFFACGRQYAARLHERLELVGAFAHDPRSPAEILEEIAAFNDALGLRHWRRLPYLYGAWKAKKKAYRWIAGTARTRDSTEEPQEGAAPPPKEDVPPKNALSEAGTIMVKVLQHVMATLRASDRDRVARGLPSRYWIIEDIDEFVQEFRVLAEGKRLGGYPWATYDFTTMYEALEHDRLITGVMDAVCEAWGLKQTEVANLSGRHPLDVDLRLGRAGFEEATKVASAPGNPWFTVQGLQETLVFLLSHLFVVNGDGVRRQQRGVPMGLECSPQLANLYAYSVESKWVDNNPPTNILTRRFIDDIIVIGPDALAPGRGIPSQDDYGMGYKHTSENPDNLIYLGVNLFVDDKGHAQTVLYDRAVDYPIQVDRYPHGSTVANPAQLGGVIMGRLVAAQRTCSRLDLFQDAVLGILTHAHRRGYPRRLVHSTWTRFLVTYWSAASVSAQELRAWFHEAWRMVVGREPQGSWQRGEREPGPPATPAAAAATPLPILVPRQPPKGHPPTLPRGQHATTAPPGDPPKTPPTPSTPSSTGSPRHAPQTGSSPGVRVPWRP